MATVTARIALTVVVVLAACKSTTDGSKPPPVTGTACGAGGTVQLGVGQAARLDCSNGGTVVTLAGNGASYLVVPEFAVDRVANQFVSYTLTAGPTALAAGASAARSSPADLSGTGLLPSVRPSHLQSAFDRALRADARKKLSSGAWRPSAARARASFALRAAAPPPAGSIRSFHVRSTLSQTNPTWKAVGARLAYVGTNVLLYIDTLAPANGFAPSQLQSFGQFFDQVLYPIDTAAFGQPSDIDQNGQFIMLMSPVVNADSPNPCSTQGFVAGFFDELDLGDITSPNSNKGEIFYTIVPDPQATVGCMHSVENVAADVPSTFLHELQHLISFSQHVIVHRGNPEAGWLDEGLSIVAQELGSVHYEQMCPPPACRNDPAQIFPDSSQGYIADALFDSYKFAQRPETASTTLHSDSDNGFAWRGGDWLLMRWLGDQFGTALYKKLDQSLLTGVANIEGASGQPFPALFADFGLALYTDSLPGKPRATAPSRDRFLTRNPRALWARLFATRGTGDVNFPLAFPLPIQSIPSTATTASLAPGTMSYYRLDTGASTATITLKFAAPGDVALLATLHPQLSIFRLPPGICTECDVAPR